MFALIDLTDLNRLTENWAKGAGRYFLMMDFRAMFCFFARFYTNYHYLLAIQAALHSWYIRKYYK